MLLRGRVDVEGATLTGESDYKIIELGGKRAAYLAECDGMPMKSYYIRIGTAWAGASIDCPIGESNRKTPRGAQVPAARPPLESKNGKADHAATNQGEKQSLSNGGSTITGNRQPATA